MGRGGGRYIMCMWRATGAMCAQILLILSICDYTPPPTPPPPYPPCLSLPSCPMAVLLSSERRLGKCRTSSAELLLHSCWCQLLCPPSLLSPRLVPSLPFVFLRKVSCCHPLASVGNTVSMLFPFIYHFFYALLHHLQVFSLLR